MVESENSSNNTESFQKCPTSLLRRVKEFHGYFRGYISDVAYLAIRVFVSQKALYLD